MKLPNYPNRIRGRALKLSSSELNSFTSHPEDLSETFRHTLIVLGYKILSLYPVYYQGWDMDAWGATAKKNGKLYRVETNHNKLVETELARRKR